ncbi:MAG: hypothetical protein ACI3VB_02675 [Oscillospiraceae bacterium]
MPEKIKGLWFEYLDGKAAEAKSEAERLAAEDRRDEAGHMKVRENIYRVFKTVFSALEAALTGDGLREGYLNKIGEISQNWQDSLDKGREHNDAERVLIEGVKLNVYQQVKEKFVEIWGAEYD